MKPTDNQKKAAAATPKPKAKTTGDKQPGKAAIRFSAVMFNIVGAVAGIMLISAIFQHHEPEAANPGETHMNAGYDWLLNSMLANNLKTIEENPDKTTQQKYEMKWGPGEILYTNKIKLATPENAIILLPPKSIIQAVGFKSVVDLPWITYFLYPRQIVYEDSIKSPLYDRANYIVSINGWGLNKTGYPVDKPEQFMVLPIKK
jgi:hypothetical protein